MEQLTKDTFNAFTKDSLVLVDFWAEWCGPCKQLGPVFEKLSKDFSGKVKFAKLNVDDNQEIAGKFGVMSIPCMVLMKNGVEVDRLVGFMPEGALKSKIDEIVAKA